MQNIDGLWMTLKKFLVPALAFLALIIISLLKVQSLHAWQYTSDIFVYDQFVNELVFHNNMAEFTYGNLLGDHAYLFLFILYPIKLLLRDNQIYFLVVINPLLFFLSTLLFYKALSIWTNTQSAIFGALAYLGGFGFLYSGLLEGIYGFHPDIAAGFLFIALTCSILIQTNQDHNKPAWNILIILIWVLLLLIKEETAILSLLFFGILIITTKKRFYIFTSIFSAGFIILDFYLIKYFQTPYNRSNTTLAINLLENLKEKGLITFFQNQQGPQITMLGYWLFVGSTIILFHALWIKRKKVNPYLAALFYTGILKIGFSLLLLDFRLTSWHNLPGGVMVIAAILLIIVETERMPWAILGLVIFSWTMFIYFEYPLIINRKTENYERGFQVQSYISQIDDLSASIPADRIVAVPMFSANEFLGKRFTLYPAGIQSTPIGIADYAVIPKNISHIYTGNFEKLFPIQDYLDQFQFIEKSKNFVLYKRVDIQEVDLIERSDFFTTFNLFELVALP